MLTDTDQMEILPFQKENLGELNAHFSRHWKESGLDAGYFLPYKLDGGDTPSGVDLNACQKGINDVGWQRWFVVKIDNQILGHCSLKGSSFKVAPHRCELGMGLEIALRNQGIGETLLKHAIQHLKTTEHIEWLDLHVMGNNYVARKLYEGFGFETVGIFRDAFRINRESLDDVMMTLSLKDQH